MALKQSLKTVVKKNPSSHAALYLLRQRLSHPQDFSDYSEESQRFLNAIQKNGFMVIPNFVDKEFCEKCICDIDLMMKEHKEFVQKYSDLRVFGAEHLSENIKKFAEDKFLKKLTNYYNTIESDNGFTLANKIEYSQSSSKLGSGGGWHRDSVNRQFKAILYLNDVTEENGAYQIIKNSHKMLPMLEDIRIGKIGFEKTRFLDKQINKIIAKDPSRLKTITGKVGTLIVKDCSAIHRGSPLKSGIRYALTNYYFYISQINDKLVNHFAPLVSPDKVLAKVKANYPYNLHYKQMPSSK